MKKELDGTYRFVPTDETKWDYDDVLDPNELGGLGICYRADFDEGQRGDGWNWEEIPPSYHVYDVYLDFDGFRINIDGYLADLLRDRITEYLNNTIE